MNWKKRSNATSIEECVMDNLGVASKAEIAKWIERSNSGMYRIDGLADAAQITLRNKKNPIVICGDYDADGIMSIAILVIALTSIGFEQVHYMIPKRHTEGYGLNDRMVSDIYEKYKNNVCLITVDNGIVAFNQVQRAKEYGWDVIVTDHHIGVMENNAPLLPAADVVIDPSFLTDTADFNDYCGAGIAWRLAKEICGNTTTIKGLLPLAAIATFADVVKLREENYALAKTGLYYLNRGFAPNGLLSLIKANSLEVVEDQDVLFKIAPQINAPGRLFPDGAEKCVEMLLSNAVIAHQYAAEIINDNEHRKKMVADVLGRIKDTLDVSKDGIIVHYEPAINPGIAGILAGQLCEQNNCPAIVLTDSMADTALVTGSCRSVEGVNIKALLDEVSSLLSFYGGHAEAAGISLKKENLGAFKDAIIEVYKKLPVQICISDDCYYDLEIKNKDIQSVIDEMAKFAPYGEGNNPLVFRITDFDVLPWNGQYVKEMAKEGVKLSSTFSSAIAFGIQNRFAPVKTTIRSVTLYGTLSINRWKGQATPQINFSDFEIVDLPCTEEARKIFGQKN